MRQLQSSADDDLGPDFSGNMAEPARGIEPPTY